MADPLDAAKCWKCGANLPREDRFCGECGAARKSSPPPSQAVAETPRRVVHPEVLPPQPLVPTRPMMPAAGEYPPHQLQHVNVAQPVPPQQLQHVNVMPGPVAPAPQQNVNVYVTHPQYHAQGESSSFAWITLLFYFLCWPLGALLNLIGLFTGPKRGCFVAMFLLFFLPSMAAIVLLIVAAATGLLEEFARELDRAAGM